MAFPFPVYNIAYPAAGFKSKTHVYCNAKNDYFPANVSGPEAFEKAGLFDILRISTRKGIAIYERKRAGKTRNNNA